MADVRTVRLAVLAWVLTACSATGPVRSGSAPNIQAHDVPPYIVVCFQPGSSDSGIANFVSSRLMITIPGQVGRDFTYPYVGAGYDYPSKQVVLGIQTNAHPADVDSALKALRKYSAVRTAFGSDSQDLQC